MDLTSLNTLLPASAGILSYSPAITWDCIGISISIAERKERNGYSSPFSYPRSQRCSIGFAKESSCYFGTGLSEF